jgi:hypothetical protein
MSMTFDTNQDFGAAVAALIDRWCEQRNFVPLARLLPAYVGFNGLTDGWDELRSALVSVRSLGFDALQEPDWTTVDDLIRAATKVQNRH